MAAPLVLLPSVFMFSNEMSGVCVNENIILNKYAISPFTDSGEWSHDRTFMLVSFPPWKTAPCSPFSAKPSSLPCIKYFGVPK